MKVLVVMGTRPDVIKLAPVVFALRRRKNLRILICVTAQHRELLDQMLSVFKLQPDFDLNIMRKGQSPEDVARRVGERLGPLLTRHKPDLVVVQGDTTTAAAAAVCADQHRIAVAHVEAGLRSFDLNNPFPEESNRITIDRLAALHFPPTRKARANLSREGLRGPGVLVTGNTIVDALLWARRRAGIRPAAPSSKHEVLVTLHRRESFGKPLKRIFRTLTSLVRKHENLFLLYPLHPNPHVRLTARRLLRHPRIHLLKPLPYLDFLRLMDRVDFVITDSGGLQEESACLGKPVVVVRKATERPEIIAAGAGKLVGFNQRRLIDWASRLLKDNALHSRMSRAKNLYGDGKAAERIAAVISRWKPSR